MCVEKEFVDKWGKERKKVEGKLSCRKGGREGEREEGKGREEGEREEGKGGGREGRRERGRREGRGEVCTTCTCICLSSCMD